MMMCILRVHNVQGTNRTYPAFSGLSQHFYHLPNILRIYQAFSGLIQHFQDVPNIFMMFQAFSDFPKHFQRFQIDPTVSDFIGPHRASWGPIGPYRAPIWGLTFPLRAAYFPSYGPWHMSLEAISHTGEGEGEGEERERQ